MAKPRKLGMPAKPIKAHNAPWKQNKPFYENKKGKSKK